MYEYSSEVIQEIVLQTEFESVGFNDGMVVALVNDGGIKLDVEAEKVYFVVEEEGTVLYDGVIDRELDAILNTTTHAYERLTQN